MRSGESSMHMISTVVFIVLFTTLTMSQYVTAADGQAIVKKQCMQCHDVTGPANADLGTLIQRKGPPLYFAGNKYKQEWLISWLQNPRTIRPAGMYYGKHIKPSNDGDKIDKATLVTHPRLGSAEAKAVASHLMNLKAKSDLIKPGEYQEGSIPMSLGEMLFDKFRGCLACHQIEPGYGGLSGPEVYTAAQRLQEDFMISYMRNPQAWDPRIFMPNKHLSDKDLQKFVHYFRALGKEVK